MVHNDCDGGSCLACAYEAEWQAREQGEPMPLQPHEQRVVEEQTSLQEKLVKLDDFMTTQTFTDLEAEDRKLLILQREYMANYNEILFARIERFPA